MPDKGREANCNAGKSPESHDAAKRLANLGSRRGTTLQTTRPGRLPDCPDACMASVHFLTRQYGSIRRTFRVGRTPDTSMEVRS